MLKSDSIKELATALNLAQKDIGGAKKDSENPFFKSKYADLASVWAACKDGLLKNGLSICQIPKTDGDRVGVETILMHKSGEWIADTFYLKPVKSDPQAAGSALSYARRYALSAFTSVVQEDDDGNEATRPHQTSNQNVSKKTFDQESADSSGGQKIKPYSGTESQKAALTEMLVERNIPVDKWEAIGQKMIGRYSKDINKVILETT